MGTREALDCEGCTVYEDRVFTAVHLENFAAFSEFHWSSHGRINVIVGENDTGKSHLLKVLYAVAKTAGDLATKEVERDEVPRAYRNKLRWTFQTPPSLRKLIKEGAKSLRVETELLQRKYGFNITRVDGANAAKFRLTPDAYTGEDVSAVFLPPKEILTIFAAIELSREKYEIYGFDDTYYDLLKLLRIPPTQGKITPKLSAIADDLDGFFEGRIVKSKSSDDFVFRRGKVDYSMPQTADGIKKLGTLTRLIRSRSLNKGSILFLDEPETNLHPRAISIFTQMLFRLGQAGVQVYLATHSYFVLKQLEILAKEHRMSVPFCSLLRQGNEIMAELSDLRDGMPDNPIIDESVRLYEQGLRIDAGRVRR